MLSATLETLRPLLRQDGGDMELVEVADGTVRLKLVGACGTCPTATQTLHAGIERILRDRVPGVVAVESV
ncbi:MAG TPA: NifU family protein [Acidimicrobiales bacterium]